MTTKLPRISKLRGKPRKIDRTGHVYGPYRVKEPVGADWRTTVYWRLECPICGHIVNSTTHCLPQHNKKHCGGCGAKAVSANEAAE